MLVLISPGDYDNHLLVSRITVFEYLYRPLQELVESIFGHFEFVLKPICIFKATVFSTFNPPNPCAKLRKAAPGMKKCHLPKIYQTDR